MKEQQSTVVLPINFILPPSSFIWDCHRVDLDLGNRDRAGRDGRCVLDASDVSTAERPDQCGACTAAEPRGLRMYGIKHVALRRHWVPLLSGRQEGKKGL